MCSHYFYYRCSDIEDPLPHTLLEAIQSKHRIISPKSKNRTFCDGIDDLLSCIDYDDDFISYNIGEYCELLDAKNWKNFMNKISNDDFLINYPVNRPTFKQWIVENLPFEVVSIKEELPEEVKTDVGEYGLQLLPGIHACDGFFIARLKKIN